MHCAGSAKRGGEEGERERPCERPGEAHPFELELLGLLLGHPALRGLPRSSEHSTGHENVQLSTRKQLQISVHFRVCFSGRYSWRAPACVRRSVFKSVQTTREFQNSSKFKMSRKRSALYKIYKQHQTKSNKQTKNRRR